MTLAGVLAAEESPYVNCSSACACSKCGGKEAGVICTSDAEQYGGNPYLKAKGRLVRL